MRSKAQPWGSLKADFSEAFRPTGNGGAGAEPPLTIILVPETPGETNNKKLRVENDRDSSSTKTKSPHTTPPRRGNLMLLEQCCWFFRKDNYVVGKY